MTEFFHNNIKPEYQIFMYKNITLSPKPKYKTNFTNCIGDIFLKKGYEQTEGDDWDIIWSEKEYIAELYEKKLQPHQKVNHFKNWFELCRKDNLIRNLKKYRKQLER
jgi:tubulin polyglutamylase TTLL9